MALRPATPPPITNTFAGGILPAAVIWPFFHFLIYEFTWNYNIILKKPVKNRPKLFDASSTALYPAIFAIELRASKT